MQQHLRALKAMDQEPSGSSMLELKLTMFEWQRHSQAFTDVLHYKELLVFLNLRTQAPESSSAEPPRCAPRKSLPPGKPIASFAATAESLHSLQGSKTPSVCLFEAQDSFP